MAWPANQINPLFFVVFHQPSKAFQERRMDRPTDHRLVWNDPVALQKAFGCAKARGAPSNKRTSRLGDQVVLQPATHKTMHMTDLRMNVSRSSLNCKSDLPPCTTVSSFTNSCYFSSLHSISLHSSGSAAIHAGGSVTEIRLVSIFSRSTSDSIQISPNPLTPVLDAPSN